MAILYKKDFIKALAKKSQFSESDTEYFLEGLVEVFKEAVLNGDEYRIRDLGRLYTQELKNRKVYNFQTGKKEELPPAKRHLFKLSTTIRWAVRNKKISDIEEAKEAKKLDDFLDASRLVDERDFEYDYSEDELKNN